jgi:hypothetical protein
MKTGTDHLCEEDEAEAALVFKHSTSIATVENIPNRGK